MRSSEYFNKMAYDGRMIVIRNHGQFYGFLTFSMCKDYEGYANKPLFEYTDHDESGNICYIEYMACMNWDKNLRRSVEKSLTERYPNIEYAVWYRPTLKNDRKVFYKRRIYEASL